MAYRVELTHTAERQLEELYLWLAKRAPQQGVVWFNGLEKAILSLDQHPKRCPLASESGRDQPVRVLHYGRAPHVYRVLFMVDEQARCVHILHVRRSARRELAPRDLDPQ